MRKKTQISSFLYFIPGFVHKSSTSFIAPTARLQQLEWYPWNFEASPLGDACRLTLVYIITSSSNFIKISCLYYSSNSLSLTIGMNPFLSLDSSFTESDVFYVERSSEESSPIRNNTPAVLNSTELSGAMARETITISSVTSP